MLLFLALLGLTTALSFPSNLLSRRETNTSDPLCVQYSTIANLSIVGSNATYRSAYLAASPEGSDPARAPLDAAIPKLPALKFDKKLNDECGNLTTVAFEAAASNFTQGIVLQYKIGVVNSAVQAGQTALGLAILMATVVGIVV